MTHGFDKDYWERHWEEGPGGTGSMGGSPPNPHLVDEVGDLAPGTALEAGCGAGAEAIWLASRGWQVTAVDISSAALAAAGARATAYDLGDRVRWVEADLEVWQPDRPFDLVTTHYAHPTIPQLDFYDRIAAWVAPGGTLLVVGHLHRPEASSHVPGHGHRHDQPPAEAAVTATSVTDRLDPATWSVRTAEERVRRTAGHGGQPGELHDVVVRAVRRT